MPGLLTESKTMMGFGAHDSHVSQVVKDQKKEIASVMKSNKSNGWASNILLMAELRKRILIFRALVDLLPCNGSVPINELLIGLIIDLHALYPEVVVCNVASKTVESPLNQVLIQLYNVLNSIGDSWHKNDGKMNRGLEPRESMENVTLEQLSQIVLGKINEMIDIRREMLEEKNQYADDKSRVEAPTLVVMSSDSNSSNRTISPLNSPTVVEHSRSSNSENPPWLFRTEAAKKLKPLEMKYLPSNLVSPPPFTQDRSFITKAAESPEFEGRKTERVSSSGSLAEMNSKKPKESRVDENPKRVSGSESLLPECKVTEASPETSTPIGLSTAVLAIQLPSQYLPSDGDVARPELPSLPPPNSQPSNGTATLLQLKSPSCQDGNKSGEEASGSESNVTSEGKETASSPIIAPPPVLRNPEHDLLPSNGFRASSPLSQASCKVGNISTEVTGGSESSLKCDDANEHPPSIHKRPPPPPPPLPPRNLSSREATPSSLPIPASPTKGSMPPPPPSLPPRNLSSREATSPYLPIPAPPTKGAMPPPPPPIPAPPTKGCMPPPPPPPGMGKFLRPKNNTRLKRSILMVYVYQVLRKKEEGPVGAKSNKTIQGKKSKIGSSAGAKQGMADAIEEITKKSAYYQQIQEDAKKYAALVLEIKAAISAFETKDMEELVKFLSYVEENLEKLSDETQVLAKFEDFPVKKLEALRGAGALYKKLKQMSKNLKNWKIVPPIGQLLDKSESYFNKIKREIETLELNKDEESKKFKSNNIHFDFNVLVQVKESMVDVSSGCMELALKEWREAKTSKGASSGGMKFKGQATASGQLLWRTFQFAYRVYSFAGGQDDRADLLTRELARAMEIDPSPK